MRITLPAVLLLAALGIAVPGCESTKLFQGNPENALPEKEEWQQTEPLEVPSFAVLWEQARDVIEGQGYGLDETRTRFDRREMVSGWQTILAPTRFEGVRRRVHLTFVAAGDRWIVRGAVVRQRNVDVDNPSNPAAAKWEGNGPDTTRTGLIIWKIRAGFDPEILGGAPPAK